MKTPLLIFIFLMPIFAVGQTISGQELLDKSIRYHDPNNNWSTFNDSLFVTMKSPKRSSRDSEIHINLPAEYFYVKATKDSIITEYKIDKGQCEIFLNGSSNIDEDELKSHGLSCESASLYKNYYSYLYGLPMKLKDDGTIINDKVELKVFQGKEYLVLKVTYEETVGNDVWYFYFNPETFAMEIYQFYHEESRNDGEYILLSDEVSISDIKMPKNRAWYYNKDDGYLGTDSLTNQ